MKRLRAPVLALAALLTALAPVRATTKGLNQIVTPDIQPLGQLSLSLQAQHPVIGNSLEAQLELGITKRFEIAVFEGFQPGTSIWNAEYSLYQKGPCLLSTGVTNWEPSGSQMMGFVEGGYYRGKQKYSLGAGYAGNQLMAILGVAYQATPSLALQVDWMSGQANFSTVGFTWGITPNLSLNPALYLSNSTPHKVYGYAVLSWTLTAW